MTKIYKGNLQGIVPFIDALQKIQKHYAAFNQKNLTLADAVPLLTEGWDYTRDRRKVDQPSDGIWRAPHLAIVKNINFDCKAMSAIIAPGMSVTQIVAGLWRQLRIFPKNEAWRRSTMDQGLHGDPFDPEVRKDDALNGRDLFRDAFLVTLIGHSVSDISEFLVDLEKTDSELAKMLLAKNFMAALMAYPDCCHLPWPKSCVDRFKRDDRSDYLPPILALILFAELARHAQGQAAHNQLSFDKRGRRVDLKTVREDIPTAADGGALAATQLLLRFKWLQSSALLAPSAVLASANKAAAYAWTEETRQKILDSAAMAGIAGTGSLNSALRPVFAPSGGTEVSKAVYDFISHPNAWSISRTNGTVSFPNRPAITFHGMTWRESASVALTLVADQARSWNTEFGDRKSIPKRSTKGRPGLAESIAAISYFWLETSAPAAFYGAYGKAARRNVVGSCQPHQRSADDLVMNEDSGKDLLKEARRCIACLPGVGEKGFSAFAHATLWIDRRHDDLRCYRALARKNFVSSNAVNVSNAGCAAYGGIPNNLVVSASIRSRGKADLPSRRKKIGSVAKLSKKAMQQVIQVAAVVAQTEAMLLGPTSTDSMHAYLLRTKRRPLGSFMKGSAIPSNITA